MKIRCNRGTLHMLPPHSAGWWEWCDVVDRAGGGDGVAPKDAHAARELLDHDDDRGVWRTSRRLESYLREQWGIELVGTTDDARQSELPTSTTGADVESRVIGANSPESPARGEPEPELVQVDLSGESAEDELEEQAADDYINYNNESSKRYPDAAEKATEDPRQTSLDAFTQRVRVGRFIEPAGSVYAGAGTQRVRVE